MSVETISKKDRAMSKEFLIQKLNSQFQGVNSLPEPKISKVKTALDTKAQSQYYPSDDSENPTS